MIATIKSELIRIKRPSFMYGGWGIMAGFAALISFFVFESAADAAGRTGPGLQFPSLDQLEATGGFVATLSAVASLVGVVTLAFWAIAAATDYDTGLIRILTQAEPNRLRLLVGKIGALTLYTVIGTFLATVAATVVAFPSASATDVSTVLWSDGFVSEFLAGWFNLTLASLVWGLVGLAIAVVTRSSGLAIATGIGYLLVVENLIGIMAEGLSTYLPGSTLAALATGGTADLGYTTALLLAVVYGATATVGSVMVFRQREIVS